jgi:hypothetical protein
MPQLINQDQTHHTPEYVVPVQLTSTANIKPQLKQVKQQQMSIHFKPQCVVSVDIQQISAPARKNHFAVFFGEFLPFPTQ